jgi:hypothetical protein
VREIKEGMGIYSTRIEEMATRKMRAENPELASDWDAMREAGRKHQMLMRQKKDKVRDRQAKMSGQKPSGQIESFASILASPYEHSLFGYTLIDQENTMNEMPKSYLPDSEREGLTQNGIYLAEAMAAGESGDEDTSWKWLALADLPAYSLMSCKKNLGTDFIRERGLNTAPADAEYGLGWLDAP